MELFIVILLSLILITTTAITLSLYKREKPEEVDHDEELNKAVELIVEYCLTRSEKERCRFNMSDNNEECVCMLLKTPPEGWNNADNTRKPQ